MGRLLQFRNEIVMLWRAFLAPETPLWLKGLMLLVPAYLLVPLDLVPDFIPIVGWIDDLIIISLLVSWLVTLVPQRAEQRDREDPNGPTIDGTARRL